MDCHVAPLQAKERALKRRIEKLNDGDGVVINQHSTRHTKEEKQREGGHMHTRFKQID